MGEANVFEWRELGRVLEKFNNIPQLPGPVPACIFVIINYDMSTRLGCVCAHLRGNIHPRCGCHKPTRLSLERNKKGKCRAYCPFFLGALAFSLDIGIQSFGFPVHIPIFKTNSLGALIQTHPAVIFQDLNLQLLLDSLALHTDGHFRFFFDLVDDNWNSSICDPVKLLIYTLYTFYIESVLPQNF